VLVGRHPPGAGELRDRDASPPARPSHLASPRDDASRQAASAAFCGRRVGPPVLVS
jgi:hypothetical protein